MKKFVVVGSGRQGVAVAYDLLLSCYNDHHHVTMIDIDEECLKKGLKNYKSLSLVRIIWMGW